MITAVVMENDTDMTFNENAYPGMSLAEACKQFEMDIMSAINEFQMDILLKEHAYLYENACEITYVDEAGNENDNGKSLRAKIADLFAFIGKKLGELLDKLCIFVSKRSEEIRAFFEKKGITKHMARSAINYYKNNFSGDNLASIELNVASIDVSKFNGSKEVEDILNGGANRNIKDFAYNYHKENVKITADEAEKAFKAVYESKSIVSTIVKARRALEKALGMKEKEILNKKDVSVDITEIKEQLNTIKTNANGYIKLYHDYFSNNVAVIRKIFTLPEVRQACFAATKAGIKAAPGKAVNAVKDAPGKAAGAAKKAFTKKEKATNESAEVDSEVYDGNYFRV